MPQKQSIRLPFPMGGRSDRYGYQSQPPHTTPAARNVWPDAQGRERGGSRPGFYKTFTTNQGGNSRGLATVNYIPNTSSRIVSLLVNIATDGDIWVSDAASGALAQITSEHHFGNGLTEVLQMTERNQKLYIADYSITQSESETTRILKVFEPTTVFDDDSVTTVVATDGTIPRGCPCICTWRDRIVLAGGTTNPYGIFASRQGEPEDWDFSETDESAAFALGQDDRAGQIGDVVTSLTPHADDCLIIGSPSSLWLLNGDPRSGGRFANLSRTIGILDRFACCTTPDGLFVFLSHDGLYAIPAGCPADNNPVSISRERIPSELKNIDASSASGGKFVSLAYDVRWRGIHIFVSSRTAGMTDDGAVHWFFDWESKSFWEVQFQEARMDVSICHARPNRPSDESVVVCGCLDGNPRTYVSTKTKDDQGLSTEKKINAYVALGPLSDEPNMESDVRVDELDLTFSSDTTDVTWSLFRGASAEEALANVTANQEATVGHATAGRNFRCYPRVSGSSLFLKLASTQAWSFEAARVLLAKLGRTRP